MRSEFELKSLGEEGMDVLSKGEPKEGLAHWKRWSPVLLLLSCSPLFIELPRLLFLVGSPRLIPLVLRVSERVLPLLVLWDSCSFRVGDEMLCLSALLFLGTGGFRGVVGPSYWEILRVRELAGGLFAFLSHSTKWESAAANSW